MSKRQNGDNADLVRAYLVELAHKNGKSLLRLSQSIRRNPTYLQQFVRRGVPMELPLEERIMLAAQLGCTVADLTIDKARLNYIKQALRTA